MPKRTGSRKQNALTLYVRTNIIYIVDNKEPVMGRFSQQAASKGSQKWIQIIINERPESLNGKIRRKLNLRKEEHIQWLSPLKCDEYAEYRDQKFIDRLGVNLSRIPLADFWPKNGPQWDALGKSSFGKLFLVEAKSHIPELISTMQAKDNGSKTKILKGLDETKHFLNIKAETDWSRPFYQYTNRIAHLYLLRQNNIPAYLMFIYFINDLEMKGTTTENEWKGAITLLHSYLGIGKHKLQNFITDIFVDVTRLE